jgi:riboflavin kinase / FMN adenylyltransferase
MRVIDDLTRASVDRPSIVTIGSFDGLHLGHHALVGYLVARAHQTGTASVLVTFHPHPRAVLRPWLSPKVLTTPGEKAVLLAQWGLDVLVLLHFTPQMAHTPAEEFVRLMAENLHMTELWVGQDFALGRGREGDVAALREMGKRYGFALHVVEPVLVDSRPASSTWVRELLAAGQVAEARRVLGRPYSIAGEVVSGSSRGRCPGYPTANLAVRSERALPPDGVYATYATIGEQRLRAVANIGNRPSFGEGQRAVEVHILDYQGNLMGRDVVVEFVQRLRPERHYTDVCQLVRQIDRDVRRSRQWFAAEEEGAQADDGAALS